MRDFLRLDRFNPLFSEKSTEFMKTLAINTAQNCPLDFKVRGLSPLRHVVIKNDVDAASALLQRVVVIEPDTLASAIVYVYSEMVKILVTLILTFLGQNDFVERCALLTANTNWICL